MARVELLVEVECVWWWNYLNNLFLVFDRFCFFLFSFLSYDNYVIGMKLVDNRGATTRWRMYLICKRGVMVEYVHWVGESSGEAKKREFWMWKKKTLRRKECFYAMQHDRDTNIMVKGGIQVWAMKQGWLRQHIRPLSFKKLFFFFFFFCSDVPLSKWEESLSTKEGQREMYEKLQRKTSIFVVAPRVFFFSNFPGGNKNSSSSFSLCCLLTNQITTTYNKLQ